MSDVPLDAVGLVNLTSLVLAVVFGVVPPLKRLFDKLGDYRATVMALTLLLVDAGYLGFRCQFGWGCIQAGAFAALLIWVEAFLAGQGLYHKAIKPVQQKLGLR